ncbi:MAG: DUF819 family protein [Thermomonas sp.]|uniref:DUF819 family protein n=1 Tax=Thermomonas sp. TaxID=1971895 RepID=UPI001B5440BB|nr:DUF819 family protein [Thermomonas sp.]MBK7204834.1 DUF819 family protein [Thermomonas sp.]MBK9669782.1 DUF819 family protein [Thermomonas sp.]MBP7158090.1 DUF819 family protein [Thermomonas sp.]MBP7787908.1 DUF819 family protein [Thermomonas sp.]MBP8615326.1 DUF819 family protein [Thermomonas sp.]
MNEASRTVLIGNDAAVLGLLAMILGFVFWGASRERGFWKKFYAVVPAILPCYLLPAIANSTGLVDGAGSGLYPMARDYLLPASLVLFCVSMDLKGIVRLGPKALVMFLTGTVGVMLGALVAFEAMRFIHPATVAGETWRGMTTIAGSWIGGGANQAAMKEVFAVDATVFGQFAAVDVIVAYLWMAVLLFMASRSAAIDRWNRADTSAIDDLRRRISDYQAQHARVASTTDLMLIFALAIGITGLAHLLTDPLVAWVRAAPAAWRLQDYSLDARFFWIVVFATTFGVLLSLTRARQLEGAGASSVGSVFLYILIATIGMQMDLKALADKPLLLLLGLIWIGVHGGLMLLVARLIRAPLFFMAVGSQANIGGAASAPVVANAFHPALAPVGVLLAVMGYALGTYCAYLTGLALRALAA